MNWLALHNFNFVHLLLLVVVGLAAFGWFFKKSKYLQEDRFNRQLRAELEDRKQAL